MVEDELDLLEKRRRLELLRERKELRENFGLAFYEPHPKQDKFHRAGKYRLRYVRTGNRFGKSDMGAAEDCAFALGYRPWYEEGDPARYEGIPQHSTRGTIIVQHWDKAKEIFTNDSPGQAKGKLFRFLPKDKIVKCIRGRASAGYSEIVVESKWGGHSIIRLNTVQAYKQDQMGFESSDWDWIHVDEPCPEGLWLAMWRGAIDRSGKGWFTCTPLSEMWINDYFIPDGMLRATFDTGFENKDKAIKRWVITGSSDDNPYIKVEDIEGFNEDLSAEEETCRRHGIPLALSGTIYKQFVPDEHIYRETPHGWESPTQPPKNYTIRVLIDPHPKVEDGVLFFATSPTERTYIFKESFSPGLTSDTCAIINAVTEGYYVERYLIDPAAYIEDPVTGRCQADEYYDYGIPVERAVKDPHYGIIKTQEMWRERRDGYPVLFVHEDCERFLWEIYRYVWDPNKQEKPLDKDDHLMECLYRGVLTGLDYVKEQKHVPRPVDEAITQRTWQKDMGVVAPLDTRMDSWKEDQKKARHKERYPA